MTFPAATEVIVRDGRLLLDGVEVATRYPVAEACLSGGRLIVLYDPSANPRKYGTFQNLVSLDVMGAERWVADTSETTTGDCYTGIWKTDPFWVFAWCGYNCRIDEETGRIVEKVFTK